MNKQKNLIIILAGLTISLFLLLGVQIKALKTQTAVPIMEKVTPKLLSNSKNILTIQKEIGFAPAAYADDTVQDAKAYIVIDEETGKILAEKNSDLELPIASLTKVMSAVVALDLANANELFRVSPTAQDKEPTKIGVVAGQKLTVDELLHAALMTSANDATQVLREGIDSKYNSDVFINAMNSKAGFLGLSSTRFENPQGFDSPDNFSSAKDLAILAHYALSNYPLIAKVAKDDYEFIPANQNHKQFDLYNWNGLLNVYPGVRGLKIGNTGAAMTTTIVSSVRDGKKVLVVVLGAPDVLARDLTASKLLDIGFEKLDLPPVGVTENDLLSKYQTWKYFN